MVRPVPGLIGRGEVVFADVVHGGGRLLAMTVRTAHRVAALASQLFLEIFPRLFDKARRYIHALIGRRPEEPPHEANRPDAARPQPAPPVPPPQDGNPAAAHQPPIIEEPHIENPLDFIGVAPEDPPMVRLQKMLQALSAWFPPLAPLEPVPPPRGGDPAAARQPVIEVPRQVFGGTEV